MKEFKFGRLATGFFGGPYQTTTNSGNDQVELVKASFQLNLVRIVNTIRFPVHITLTAQAWQACTDRAVKQVAGPNASPDEVDRLGKEVLKTTHALMDEYVDRTDRTDPGLAQSAGTRGIANTEFFTHVMGKAGRDAMEGLLTSVLTQSWTMFEVLAGDLWVAAVNARPASLGAKAIEAKPFLDTEDDEDDEDKVHKTALPLDVLKQFGFDLSASMGTMFRGRRRFKFDRLGKMKHAYQSIFGQPGRSLFEVPHPNNLETLEAIRNLIVHTAGVVDDIFLSRVQKHPVFGKLQVSTRFSMDGEIANTYANLAASSSVSLIGYVDKWLTDNPK